MRTAQHVAGRKVASPTLMNQFGSQQVGNMMLDCQGCRHEATSHRRSQSFHDILTDLDVTIFRPVIFETHGSSQIQHLFQGVQGCQFLCRSIRRSTMPYRFAIEWYPSHSFPCCSPLNHVGPQHWASPSPSNRGRHPCHVQQSRCWQEVASLP